MFIPVWSCLLLFLSGAALVAVCDVSKQEDITYTMKTLGLLCHRPDYYPGLKPRGVKAYENVSF